MNSQSKILVFIFFFAFFQAHLFAQTYVRILRNGDYTLKSDGRKVKLFEGEIYELFSKEIESKLRNGKKGIFLKFEDTQVEVPWGAGTKQTYEYPVTVSTDTATLYKENKHKFVQQSALDSNTYVYDLSLVETDGQISIASQSVKDIIKIKTKRKDKFTAEYFRKHFANRYLRIIIPNFPTLILDSNDITITQTAPTNSTVNGETSEAGETTQNPTEQFEPATSSRNDWKFILGIVALILVGLLVYINRNKILGMRESSENNPIGRNMNPNLKNTPKKKSEVKPQQGRSEQENENPQEKHDIATVPHSNGIKNGVEAENEKLEISQEEIEAFIDPEAMPKQETNLGTVIPTEPRISSKILENVIEEKDTLRQELTELKLANEDLLQDNVRLQQEIEAQQAQQLGLPPNIMPYYVPFCEFNKELIDFLEQTEHMANRFYEQCVRQNSQEEKGIIEVILFRFFQQKNKLQPLNRWKDTLAELEKGNVWQDDLLDIIFNPQLSESQKIGILQNDIFVQVHQPYLTTVLLLAEEMRCVGQFTGFEFALSQEMKDYFGKAIKQICDVAEQKLGSKVHYIPLFERPENAPDALVKIVPPFSLTAIYDRINVEAGFVKAIKKYGLAPEATEIMLA